MKCKSRGSSGLLRHTSIDSRPSSTIEHPPKGNGCIERKFLRKRHSMPHNNRIVLGDFQLHIGDEENWHAHVSRRLSMPATRPVPSKRKESVGSRGSIGSVAMQELTRILLTRKKDPKLHERLQSFYQDTGKEDFDHRFRCFIVCFRSYINCEESTSSMVCRSNIFLSLCCFRTCIKSPCSINYRREYLV